MIENHDGKLSEQLVFNQQSSIINQQ